MLSRMVLRPGWWRCNNRSDLLHARARQLRRQQEASAGTESLNIGLLLVL